MKYKILFIIAFSVISNSSLFAQILKTISKFDSLSNLTYEMSIIEKDPFSDKLYKDTLKAYFDISNSKELFKVEGKQTLEVYDGGKLIQMDLNNLTYRIHSEIDVSTFRYKSLPYIISTLKKDLNENVPVITHNDSTINGKLYFNIKIIGLDTIKKNKRVYRFVKVLIDKESYLPIWYRNEQQGFIDGTDMFVNTYSEIHFYDYRINKESLNDLSSYIIPSNFTIEKLKDRKPLLIKGSKAPELNLKEINGEPFSLNRQKGKVILLNFTSISCPHSIESVNMLNNLYSEYTKRKFSIITINPFDDKESVEKFNKKLNIKYPVFLNIGVANTDNYNVYGYPTFYLIDKNGNIIKGFSGYNKSLEYDLKKIGRVHV
jgi:peroxiredoxin